MIKHDDPIGIAEVLKIYDSGIKGSRKIVTLASTALQQTVSRATVCRILSAHRGEKPPFSQGNIDETLTLRAAGVPAAEIADRLGLKEHTVHEIRSQADLALTPSPQQHPAIIADRKNIETSWRPGRYAVISDSHIRFHEPRAFEEVLALKGDFDGCVVVGDFIDAHWLSTFAKYGYIPFAHEIQTATLYMHKLAKKFGRVLYLQGNHEQRLLKRIIGGAEHISNLVQDKGAAEIVYKALHDVRKWYFGNYPGVRTHDGWFVQIGQAILAHADSFSIIHGRAAINIVEHMMGYRQAWGLGTVDCIIEAHLHRHSGPMRKWGVFIWELPCMCGVLDYQLTSQARRGQVDTGWSVLEQRKDGTMRFNTSRSFYLLGS